MIRKKPMPQPRNPVVMIARQRAAGFLRDRRKRRSKDRLAREIREAL
jgi:hypothetical protein